jgi:hypothetical protein
MYASWAKGSVRTVLILSRLENKGHDPLFCCDSDESQARSDIMRGRDETWTGVKRGIMTLITCNGQRNDYGPRAGNFASRAILLKCRLLERWVRLVDQWRKESRENKGSIILQLL